MAGGRAEWAGTAERTGGTAAVCAVEAVAKAADAGAGGEETGVPRRGTKLSTPGAGRADKTDTSGDGAAADRLASGTAASAASTAGGSLAAAGAAGGCAIGVEARTSAGGGGGTTAPTSR